MPELFCSRWQNIESRGASEVETLHVPNQLIPRCVCRKSSKANFFEGKRANEAKSCETKKHNFHEKLDLLCFRWQKYRVKGAWEIETLHVVSQLLLLCVCQISSKLNTFQRKKASEEKSCPTKKTILRDSQPTQLLIKKSWVKGNVGSWDYACSLVKYLQYVSAKFQLNRTAFRVKGLATKEMVKRKTTKFTRCSIHSASDDKISSQGVPNKMKLYM